MNKMYLVLTLIISSSLFAGEREGGGGFIDALIRTELEDKVALTDEEIDKLVKSKGLEIKTKIIKPLYEQFLVTSSRELSKPLREIQRKIKLRTSDLMEDIDISHIETGDCKGATTCTEGKHFASIIIDKESIANSTYGVSFSELVSLLVHEYLHHFYSEVPDHDRYYLARYVKEVFLGGEYNEKKYGIHDMIYTPKHSWIFRGAPDLFCKYKGHMLGAKAFEKMHLGSLDLMSLNLIQNVGDAVRFFWVVRDIGIKENYVISTLYTTEDSNMTYYRSITCFSR